MPFAFLFLSFGAVVGYVDVTTTVALVMLNKYNLTEFLHYFLGKGQLKHRQPKSEMIFQVRFYKIFLPLLLIEKCYDNVLLHHSPPSIHNSLQSSLNMRSHRLTNHETSTYLKSPNLSSLRTNAPRLISKLNPSSLNSKV